MSLDKARARQFLRNGDLRALFVDALGWDRHSATLDVSVAGAVHSLQALAQKRGMVAWLCPAPAGQRLPDYAQRRRIERQVAKSAHEHLIVFTDAANETQVWQWVKRELGKPTACREHIFHHFQPGDALLQKLEAIAFTIEEEERLSLTDVTRRARVGFDVERVTKRFYDRFQKEHAAFLKFISGITECADQEWYASVMLNRLMFVYFMQRKGFLDEDRDYLRNRLNRMRAEHGRDRFYSFYRYFLLRLFHEGLGGARRSTELEEIIGRIPYLNGSLFDIHELERPGRYGNSIQIPDEAFERIFDYFDQYQWHLDERPLRADNEINPDVLGYIFEKYINQKQMGAYYTKEDITEYISRNTVLPSLFDTARARCRVAFENSNGPTVWDLLKDDPDRYIYAAVRHGSEEPLPEDIAAGLNPPTLNRRVSEVASVNDIDTIRLRKNWNKPAPETHALPTETWRELIARRERYQEVRAKLVAGEVRDINDLITLNLDIRQFAQDVIENCEGPELLRAFWHAIQRVTILDPTCGSGAFLFAALNTLEPLYEACLDRMEAFVADLARSGAKHRPEKFLDFRKVLANVTAHPNRRYFIFKSIMLNNLYGVDIMEEAVELCKLRLFLKLAAQVEPDRASPNLGIEPLPDIDFNIRAGNTLVGYATYAEVENAVQDELDFDNTMERISVRAADLQQAFDAFRARQVDPDGSGSVPTEHKQELRRRLKALDDELNLYLAYEYGVQPFRKDAYAKWLSSHQPFHWFVEFYGIMSGGGFDVVIGNPPWKEYTAAKKDYAVRNYAVEKSGNLYALCSERSLQLLTATGYLSFIVQLPFVSSSRMVTLRQHLAQQCSHLHLMTCDDRPGKLFDGLQHCRNCIFIAKKRRNNDAAISLFTTQYRRWATEARDTLFTSIEFTAIDDEIPLYEQFPKVGRRHLPVFRKLFSDNVHSIKVLLSPRVTDDFIFYQEATQYWAKATVGLPYYSKNGKVGAPAHGRYLFFQNADLAHAVCALLNSSLFYSYFIAYGDCFHLSDALVTGIPALPSSIRDRALTRLSHHLMRDLRANAVRTAIETKAGAKISYDQFGVAASAPIIVDIDRCLAKHYGLTEEELDFVINYDIKYRMGGDEERLDE
jgi:hypothetical protein